MQYVHEFLKCAENTSIDPPFLMKVVKIFLREVKSNMFSGKL
jgi:hypothetical protein